MKERVLTGSMIFLIVVFAVLSRVFSIYIFDGFVVALMLLSSFESSNLFAKMSFYNNKKIVMAFPPLLYGLFLLLIKKQLSFVWAFLSVLALIVGLFLITFLLNYVFKAKTDNEIKTREFKNGFFKFSLNKAVHTLMSLLYPSIGLFFLILLNSLTSVIKVAQNIENTHLISFIAIGFMLVITTATDIFSMLVGKIFGKRKLAKNISPNKTVEGTVGGILFAILFSVFTFVLLGAFENFSSLFYNLGISLWSVLLLSFVGAIVSVGGDLFESFLKRKANVKDSGNFLPGHGGFLDRFDGHVFNAIWVFFFFLILL